MVHSNLATTRNQFNDQDASLEEDFSAAVTAVKQGYSETNLDSRVEQALYCLNLIESNYRNFHKSMVAIAQQHPKCAPTNPTDKLTCCSCAKGRAWFSSCLCLTTRHRHVDVSIGALLVGLGHRPYMQYIAWLGG